MNGRGKWKPKVQHPQRIGNPQPKQHPSQDDKTDDHNRFAAGMVKSILKNTDEVPDHRILIVARGMRRGNTHFRCAPLASMAHREKFYFAGWAIFIIFEDVDRAQLQGE